MARDHTSYIPPPYIEAMGFTLPLNSKNGWSPFQRVAGVEFSAARVASRRAAAGRS